MAAFEYTALDERGKQQRGVLEADSVRQIRQLLRDRGMAPMSVSAAANGEGRTASAFARRISTLDLSLLTRQLAVLVGAAIPLEEALRAVAQQSNNRRVTNVLMSVRAKVLEGHSLASALQDHPRTFSHLYRSTVAAGEMSGHLDDVLVNLADYSERQQQFQQNIQLAMIYPIVLVALSFLIVAGMLIYVVPKIVTALDSAGGELPTLTKVVIWLSEFMQSWYLLVFGGIVLAVVVWRWLLRQPRFRERWDRFLLNAAGFRTMVRGANAARYAGTLAIMTRSGVPLVEAMRIAAEVMDNVYLKGKVEQATQRVREGTSLNEALTDVGFFPPLMLHMVASGEMSGELDSMLERVAHFQQNEMERIVSSVIAVFQPLMLLVMGIMVLMIVLAILMPIISMNQLVG